MTYIHTGADLLKRHKNTHIQIHMPIITTKSLTYTRGNTNRHRTHHIYTFQYMHMCTYTYTRTHKHTLAQLFFPYTNSTQI